MLLNLAIVGEPGLENKSKIKVITSVKHMNPPSDSKHRFQQFMSRKGETWWKQALRSQDHTWGIHFYLKVPTWHSCVFHDPVYKVVAICFVCGLRTRLQFKRYWFSCTLAARKATECLMGVTAPDHAGWWRSMQKLGPAQTGNKEGYMSVC